MARDRYLEPYRQSGRRHGPTDFRVTLWASPQSQARRFDVFTQMLYLDGKRILDAGCSRGDFAVFLIERGIDYAGYVGIDALDDVIDHARRRNLPRAEFLAGDFVHQVGLLATGRPQVVCISGTLNTMTDDEVSAVLEGAWSATQEALIFNFLSDRCSPKAPPQDDFARRLDTMHLMDWALSKTWCVNFRQDYFREGHDATILMRKSR